MSAGFNVYWLLADVVLVAHLLFVAFVVLGFVAIWIGYFARWQFVCDLRFRAAQLLAMAVVLAEAVFGLPCPLTILETALRPSGGEVVYQGSFIQHWVGRLIFYECREGTFTVLYAAFFALIVLTFWMVPPRWSRRAKA